MLDSTKVYLLLVACTKHCHIHALSELTKLTADKHVKLPAQRRRSEHEEEVLRTQCSSRGNTSICMDRDVGSPGMAAQDKLPNTYLAHPLCFSFSFERSLPLSLPLLAHVVDEIRNAILETPIVPCVQPCDRVEEENKGKEGIPFGRRNVGVG